MSMRVDPSVPSARLHLPQVTLCAATSINVKATVRALEMSLEQVNFAKCKLFTHAVFEHSAIEVVEIDRLDSSTAYSKFILSDLVDNIDTDYAIVAQWDGFVINADLWNPEFLDLDYIGASWPQFDDGLDVGNGGFSLRSRRLMEACRRREFRGHHPEDVLIGRVNRHWLEEQGMKFAPRGLADTFSTERSGCLGASFGFHGVWHMPKILGTERFWQLYLELDELGTVRHDIGKIAKEMLHGRGSIRRAFRLAKDYLL